MLFQKHLCTDFPLESRLTWIWGLQSNPYIIFLVPDQKAQNLISYTWRSKGSFGTHTPCNSPFFGPYLYYQNFPLVLQHRSIGYFAIFFTKYCFPVSRYSIRPIFPGIPKNGKWNCWKIFTPPLLPVSQNRFCYANYSHAWAWGERGSYPPLEGQSPSPPPCQALV